MVPRKLVVAAIFVMAATIAAISFSGNNVATAGGPPVKGNISVKTGKAPKNGDSELLATCEHPIDTEIRPANPEEIPNVPAKVSLLVNGRRINISVPTQPTDLEVEETVGVNSNSCSPASVQSADAMLASSAQSSLNLCWFRMNIRSKVWPNPTVHAWTANQWFRTTVYTNIVWPPEKGYIDGITTALGWTDAGGQVRSPQVVSRYSGTTAVSRGRTRFTQKWELKASAFGVSATFQTVSENMNLLYGYHYCNLD